MLRQHFIFFISVFIKNQLCAWNHIRILEFYFFILFLIIIFFGRGGGGLVLCNIISISISISLLVSNVITVSIVSIVLV